jgi:hypothetical protein
VKTLVTFRSKSVVSKGEEIVAATFQIPAPATVWDPSTDDFFCELLYFCRIELVHLIPNAITIVSSFIPYARPT